MNKMKKLLSVLLAVVLALSCMSVMASAARANYKQVADLVNNAAYSPYGQVTRLSTEERASILLDELDKLLPSVANSLGISGNLVDLLGIKIVVDLTSVDGLCNTTIDSVYTSTKAILWPLASALIGDIGKIKMNTWQENMTRDTVDQLTILREILELLANNRALVDAAFDGGLGLGIVANFIPGLDLTDINKVLTDLPGLIKGMIFPMFERWDQTLEEVAKLESAMSGNGNVVETLDWLVNNYFTTAMSMTTVKADAAGNLTSKHNLPTGDTNRRKFAVTPEAITVYQYYTQSDVDAYNDALGEGEAKRTANQYYEEGVYYLEQETAGSDTYVYKYQELDADGNPLKDADGNLVKTTLKYYETDSYWLPSFAKAGGTLHIKSEKAIDLLYKMIPYVFAEMAPTVLNGSVQKLLAGLFGVKWTNVGNFSEMTAAELQAIPGYDASLAVFGEEGDYLWEWSAFNYVANGEATNKDDYYFYRFQDQLFVGDASGANDMIEIIKWGWNVTGDFMNEFIPGNAAATAAGNTYDHILMSFNNFLVKAANLVLDYDAMATLIGGTTAADITPVKGTNDVLVANVKKVAQAVIKCAPETIFGTPYEGTYYDLITSTGVAAGKASNVENDLVLTGIAALLIDALAPQAHMPSAESLANQEVKIGGLLAAMVRELATQILPSVDYDALIYSDYNSNTFLAGKDNSYWLDVLMTMGVDLGFKYLRAFADLGEDQAAWTALCETSDNDMGYAQDLAKKYSADAFNANPQAWEDKVDYIIDWALIVGEYTWNVGNLVSVGSNTVDLATAQDPWLKLDALIDSYLFLDQLTSETDLEVGLRGTILDLVDLNWGNILGTPDNAGIVDIPANSKLRTDSIISALTTEVKDLVNGLFSKIGGGSYMLIPSQITTLDTLANQANLVTMVGNLLEVLDDAYNNGLLVTVLPFINMFLGWKTSETQVLADPVINASYRDGNDYVFAYNSSFDGNAITFTNDSSNMLESHRGTNIVDNEYAITIDSITHDATVNSGMTITPSDTVCSPYETISLNFGGTYGGEEAVAITIAYSYIGKDGRAIGGQNKLTVYALISSQYEDGNYDGRLAADKDEDYVGASEYKAFYFTEDIQKFVTEFQGTLSGTTSSTGAASTKNFGGITYPDSGWLYKTIQDGCTTVAEIKYHTTANTTYFTGVTSQSEAGWANSINGKGEGGVVSTSGTLYKLNTTLTEEEMPYGVYDIGAVGVKYGSDTKVFAPTFIHYNDYGIAEMYDKYMGYGIEAEDVSSGGTTAYNNYKTALKKVVYLAKYPMMTTANSYANAATSATEWTNFTKIDGVTAVSTDAEDYVKGIMPQIEPAMAALETAYQALKPYLAGGENASATGASTAELEAFLDAEAKNEINFQDYSLYEYFNFADLRTASRKVMASYQRPSVMDTYYIDGSGITEAELNKVIAAETNANIKAGITASRKTNSAEAIAASKLAHDKWVSPTHTELWMDNQVSALNFYRDLLSANGTKTTDTTYAQTAEVFSSDTIAVAADLKFIAREIAYADANYPMSDEAVYTEASWAEYKAAYDKAVAATASMKPSEVFAAKYELMVKMKDLLRRDNSANLLYDGYDRLLAAKAKGDKILATPYAELVLTAEAIEAGYTVDTALAAVMTAYGYYYTGEDGNTWNLYNDSVLEYIDNDRPNKSTNWRRMDRSSTALNNAVALFEMQADEAPELGAISGSTGAFGDVVTDATGLTTGYIYGVKSGDTVDSYFELVDPSAGYTKTLASTLSTTGTVNGTGAKIQVYNNSDVMVAEYTLVIFGDLDGNGAVANADMMSINACVAVGSSESLQAVQVMAGDIDANGAVANADMMAVNGSVASGDASSLPVNPYVA